MSDERNVISLAEKAKNGAMQTPKQALEDCISNIGEKGAFKEGKKLLVLALDDTSGNFSVSFVQAGMKMSECVTLCEVAKTIFLREMEYI